MSTICSVCFCQVRNYELDEEQWHRDERSWENEMSTVVMDMKIAGDVIKDNERKLKQCEAKSGNFSLT